VAIQLRLGSWSNRFRSHQMVARWRRPRPPIPACGQPLLVHHILCSHTTYTAILDQLSDTQYPSTSNSTQQYQINPAVPERHKNARSPHIFSHPQSHLRRKFWFLLLLSPSSIFIVSLLTLWLERSNSKMHTITGNPPPPPSSLPPPCAHPAADW